MRDAAYDITINGRGYMLARSQQLGSGGRAWNVQPLVATRALRTDIETQYGNLPSQVEAPMVWLSGHLGYGDDQQMGAHRYHYAENIDARFPGQVFNGPKITPLTVEYFDYGSGPEPVTDMGQVRRFAEYKGELYFVAGRYIAKVVEDPVVEGTFTARVIVDLDPGNEGLSATDIVVFDGKAYVGMGYEEPMWVCDNHVWTQCADVCRGYFVVHEDRLYASDSPSSVRFVARGSDPADDANWSAIYYIGDTTSEITSLAALGELIYVGKTNGLHVLDASFISPAVTPELRPYASAENCVNLTPWHGVLWVPHLRGLLIYRDMGTQGFLVRSATPGRGASQNNPVQGWVTALAGDDEWLYATIYTGQDSYLLAGREAGEGETGSTMLWHPLAKMEGVRCQALFLSPLFDGPRLWIGLGTVPGFIILPQGSGHPLQDPRCLYAERGSYYLPASTWFAPNTVKVWKSIEIEAENLSVVNYIEVYYRIDDVNNTSPWIKHSDVVNRSPSHVLAFSEGGIAGHKIEIRLDFVLGNPTKPICLRSVVLLGAERPKPVERIMAVIRCADYLPTRLGRPCERTAEQIRSELCALGQLDHAVELVDPAGISRWVLVQPGIGEREVEQEGNLPRELLLQVEMTAFEAVSSQPVSGNFAIYDESTYESGDIYR